VQESIIFSCFNQDQEMDRVDFPNLAARLRQNTGAGKAREHVVRSPDARADMAAHLGQGGRVGR
jgi:hypothetical protein